MGGPLQMVDKLPVLHYDGGRGRNRWDCIGSSSSPIRTGPAKEVPDQRCFAVVGTRTTQACVFGSYLDFYGIIKKPHMT
jgi:hypothetical protein